MTSARPLSLLVLLIPALLCAQGTGVCDGSVNIRVHSDLVLINVLVTDQHGGVITSLDKSQFRLFEDGVEQVIKYHTSEDVPVSIGLVLDASGSMSSVLALLKEAAIQFVRAANPSNEYFVVEFQDRPHLLVPFTTDADLLARSIDHIKAGGNTALLDAVHLAVDQMRNARCPRKALLVISDGFDTHSRYSERQTKRLIAEAGFPIYSIRLCGRPTSQSRYATPKGNPAVLEEWSAPTGGRSFTVYNPKKLQSTVELITAEIRHEYLLGYVPSTHPFPDGKFHRVRVKVEPPPGQRFRVSNRAGYNALTR